MGFGDWKTIQDKKTFFTEIVKVCDQKLSLYLCLAHMISSDICNSLNHLYTRLQPAVMPSLWCPTNIQDGGPFCWHTHTHMHMKNLQCTELKLSRTDTARRELRESEKERELCCMPICIACPITTQRCQPCYWAPWQAFTPNTHYCLSSHQRTQPFRKKTHHDNWQFYNVLHHYRTSNYAIFPIIKKSTWKVTAHAFLLAFNASSFKWE